MSRFAKTSPATSRGTRIPCPAPTSFVLTNGAAGAIDLVCAALLDPGDVVISEVPTFTGSIRTMRGHQADIVGIHMDDEGIRLDDLESAVARLRRDGRTVKFIYTIPTFQNPTGIDMSMARRRDLIRFAAEQGILILEDTAYAELYFGAERLPSLSAIAGGHGVITAGTFSKVIATGLRVGWAQASPELINAMLPARFDMGNSPVLHRMLHEYITGGEFAVHVDAMRGLYRRKVETLSGALRELGDAHVDFTTPEGGFFLWLHLQDGITARDLQTAAFEEGVIFPAGNAFYPDRDPGPDGESIRLAYSWTSEDDLREGAGRLAEAFRRVAPFSLARRPRARQRTGRWPRCRRSRPIAPRSGRSRFGRPPRSDTSGSCRPGLRLLPQGRSRGRRSRGRQSAAR